MMGCGWQREGGNKAPTKEQQMIEGPDGRALIAETCTHPRKKKRNLKSQTEK
jgi:hypothetical protein